MNLTCGKFNLDLNKTQVMGVLNVTPDSFSDGGYYSQIDAAILHANQMISDGVDIIDIGGESTRPGAEPVSVEDELKRVIPLIEALANEIDIPLSIDTSKATVMYEAVIAGASIINDVNALQSEKTRTTAAQLNKDKNTALCLMHKQGNPKTMQSNPSYHDVISDVTQFLTSHRQKCVALGINPEQIIFDPGFGFGKRLEHNLTLLKELEKLVALGQPLLVGLSRKSMLGEITGKEIEERLAGSISVATLAAYKGAHIIRVHDVAETRDALDIVSALGR